MGGPFRVRWGTHRAIQTSLAVMASMLPATNTDLQGQALTEIRDINPDPVRLTRLRPGGGTGGRVNGLAVTDEGETLYAASEWGGLYKSTDGGETWRHLDGHVPTATWDVAVDPSDPDKVYATSFYDGKVQSLAGINVSTDGGLTWTRPPTASAPSGSFTSPPRRDEPSAFGIAIDPDAPDNVYIGTNTGLAISNDAGATWRFVDPTPNDRADDIWDVVVHDGGVIDLVGDDGHRRSVDGGNSWTTATSFPLPGPSMAPSITVSPDEPYVLFATVANVIYESDDGGNSWPTVLANPESSPQGRIPFVRTNHRSGAGYDLWFGDRRLFRTRATTPTPPGPGGTPRAPINSWTGGFVSGAHLDVGDLAFVLEPGESDDACPVAFSNDGGVYVNTETANPACQSPEWKEPDVTPHALWLWGMDGADQPSLVAEDVYFGTQDNGVFGTIEAGGANPGWVFGEPGDVFDAAAEPGASQYTLQGAQVILNLGDRALANRVQLATSPPGNIAGFTFGVQAVRFGSGRTVLLTSSGAFITQDVTANPVVWTQLGASSQPAERMCSIQVASGPTGVTFYVRTISGPGACNARTPDDVWRFDGTDPGGAWAEVDPPSGSGGFGAFAVDPGNPERLIASHLPQGGADPSMVTSTDGGVSWTPMPSLDALMSGGGVFRPANRRGPTGFTGFLGYPQPSLVAISPEDPGLVVAGGIDSGVFASFNGGVTWRLITDPIDGAPHIPRPRFAHFSHERGLTSRGNQQWHQNVSGTIGAAENNDRFGRPLASSDFNGDGFEDLAIGIPDEGLEGVRDVGTIREVGAVSVLYGSENRLTAQNDQQWHQNSPGVLGAAERSDHFGAALAAGDFDGDGFGDLAVGVPDEGLEGVQDVGTIDRVGAIGVFYGSPAGLTANGDQQWHQDSPGVLGAAERNDHFGSALAAGDFNGDGLADLAIGAPDEGLEGVQGVGTIERVGAVSVFYGSTRGLSATGNQQWHQDSPEVLGAAERDDRFGSALGAGDFNGDGFADLAIGVPHEGLEGIPDVGVIREVGAVSVLYGSSEGLAASGNQQWHQNVPGIVGVAESGDHFGAALAAGDFNGDGRTDLAIGAPDEGLEGVEGVGSVPRAGAVAGLFGTSAGLSETGNQQWHQDSPGVLDVAERGDRYGAALAADDFNGDARADLAIGAPGEGIEDTQGSAMIPRAGAVGVLYGSAAGLGSAGNRQFHQDVPGVLGVAERSDLFGSALGRGDFDGDGFADLAIGVPDEDLEGVAGAGTIRNVGAVNVLYGAWEVVHVYVGTQGRGVWRIGFQLDPPDVFDPVP